MAASFERRSVISALTFLRSIRMAKPPGRFRSLPDILRCESPELARICRRQHPPGTEAIWG